MQGICGFYLEGMSVILLRPNPLREKLMLHFDPKVFFHQNVRAQEYAWKKEGFTLQLPPTSY